MMAGPKAHSLIYRLLDGIGRQLPALFLSCALSLLSHTAQAADDVVVKFETSYGDITINLYADKAPKTVENFLSYVDSGHYDNTLFHRVISNFMIQGGGFDVDMVEKPTGDPVVNESRNRMHNVRGTIAMARTNDPDSATAQFFINQRSNLRLDWAPGQPGYTVFGEVIDGLSLVDMISITETSQAVFTTDQGRAPFSDVPIEPVILLRAFRVAAP